ncbi:MAG: hypothetical protein ACXABD_01435 [Candidatus Thorarchaeota archaeon]|jgi:hypothetical protein
MTLSGIQVSGSLTVQAQNLDALDTHKLDGMATFNEVSSLRPADPQAISMPAIYIQVDADLNSKLVYHPNASGGNTDTNDDSYSFTGMTLSSSGPLLDPFDPATPELGYNPKLNLPVLDGAGVSVSCGQIAANGGEGAGHVDVDFTVTLTLRVDNQGGLTGVTTIGGGPAFGSIDDNPLEAQVGYWEQPTASEPPTYPSAPGNTADDDNITTISLQASMLTQYYRSTLDAIDSTYTFNAVSDWTMTINPIEANVTNSISQYARNVGRAGQSDHVFERGFKMVINTPMVYAVPITPIGGGSAVELISPTNVFGVVRQVKAEYVQPSSDWPWKSSPYIVAGEKPTLSQFILGLLGDSTRNLSELYDGDVWTHHPPVENEDSSVATTRYNYVYAELETWNAAARGESALDTWWSASAPGDVCKTGPGSSSSGSGGDGGESGGDVSEPAYSAWMSVTPGSDAHHLGTSEGNVFEFGMLDVNVMKPLGIGTGEFYVLEGTEITIKYESSFNNNHPLRFSEQDSTAGIVDYDFNGTLSSETVGENIYFTFTADSLDRTDVYLACDQHQAMDIHLIVQTPAEFAATAVGAPQYYPSN